MHAGRRRRTTTRALLPQLPGHPFPADGISFLICFASAQGPEHLSILQPVFRSNFSLSFPAHPPPVEWSFALVHPLGFPVGR